MMCLCDRFVRGISNTITVNLATAQTNFMKSKINCCTDKVGLQGLTQKTVFSYLAVYDITVCILSR